ncbi:hypothetical protein F4776DRAFT_329605 [Hypoxylon sp. NC0597]|nr:hypothetical protein F4776DRAFT_329605 [Hypoxylon sp. NC0597]
MLKRSGSSTFSVRSELPAPRNSKERRRLARDSVDAWPSSGEETPVFNTPESNITNAGTPHAVGHHFDPLAMASMMIATAELDRLSSRASLDQTSRTSGSSTGFSGSSPISHTPLYTDPTSPSHETPESAALHMPPTIPFNTPSSSAPQSGIVSPVSRPPQRRGQRRRGQRSRLSEVTTPDDIASPGELAEEFSEGRPSCSSSQIETLPECSATSKNENEDSLYPKPLAINRNSREVTGIPGGNPSADTRKSSLTSEPAGPKHLPTVPEKRARSQSQPTGEMGLGGEESILAPTRISSIGKTPESMYGPRVASANADEQALPTMPPELGYNTLSLTISSDIKTTVTRKKASIVQVSTTIAEVATGILVANPDVDKISPINQPITYTSPESCHPNTWSESQGEPGDSNPFCPPDCLETRHSSQDSQDTGETVVRMLSVHEGIRLSRYSDSELAGRCMARTAKDERKDRNSEPA